jgi:hypothetical protein
METVGSSETSINFYKTGRHRTIEDYTVRIPSLLIMSRLLGSCVCIPAAAGSGEVTASRKQARAVCRGISHDDIRCLVVSCWVARTPGLIERIAGSTSQTHDSPFLISNFAPSIYCRIAQCRTYFFMIFSPLSLFWKKYSRLMRSRCCLCVCLCIPPIVARQRLGKNPPIVAKLGRNFTAVTITRATIEVKSKQILYKPHRAWISGSHSGHYEKYGLLGCSTVMVRKEPDVSDKHYLHVHSRRVNQLIKKFWDELIAYFPWYDTGHIENAPSNNSSIVACVFITAVAFLTSCCLATTGGFLLSRCLAR